jgi:hypothetical protein
MNWHELFEYSDGRLLLRVPTQRKRVGDEAGSQAGKGYRQVKMPGPKRSAVYVREHRVIWEMHHGPVPDGWVVDHVDGDTSNNRLENLRLATISQNAANAGHHSDNILKRRGVYFDKAYGRYRAQIMVRGERMHLGVFDCPDEAANAYQKAARQHFGEFARTS